MQATPTDTSHGVDSRGPVRTCVGCRKRDARSLLVRLVLREGHVVVDPSAAAPGRGAWLHPSGECLALAVKRRAFTRALRVENADASRLGEEDLHLRLEHSSSQTGLKAHGHPMSTSK